MWFVIIVAGVSGLPRLLLARRFAELQHGKLQQKNSIKRTRFLSFATLLVVVSFVGLYFSRWGHEAWIAIAIVFSILSAGEFFFQSQFPNTESLVFQNRLLGILYLGLSIGSYILLSRI